VASEEAPATTEETSADTKADPADAKTAPATSADAAGDKSEEDEPSTDGEPTESVKK
jgi:hypothetical protein